MTIPAYVNPAAGNSERATTALEASGRFTVSSLEPARLEDELRAAVERGVPRVLVGGGDGTIAMAARALAGTPTALAILPGGTLNHFARDHGIPLDPDAAVRAALSTRVGTVDLAWVNDRLFLNTSSVGAYVLFVRTRERLERRLGYRVASVLAALRLLGRVHGFQVEVDAPGETLRRRSSLLFIGVGERELRIPTLGGRIAGGRRALHVVVLPGGTTARLAAIGAAAMVRGLRAITHSADVDALLTDRVRIELPRPRGGVAIDGELVEMCSPLEFRIARDALRLVQPDEPEPLP